MRKFNTKASFSLVIALLLIPILLLGWLFIEQSDKDIAFAKKELSGLDYIGTIFPILTKTDESPEIWLSLSDNFIAKRSEYDPVFGSGQVSANVIRLLQAKETQSSDLMNALQSMISHVGDQSNLILDPDLDSYYLMDSTILRTPKVLRELDSLADALKQREAVGDNNSISNVQTILAAERMKESLTNLQASISAALLANKDRAIDPGLYDQVQMMIDEIGRLVEKKPSAQEAGEIYAINEQVADAFLAGPIKVQIGKTFESSAKSLRHLLSARIDRFNTKLKLALSLCGVVALFALALSFSVFRSILNTLDDRIVFLAEHDVMTELKNRAAFSASFVENMVAAVKNNNSFAVHIIDIDGFKGINDSLGHQAGDTILKTVAQKLIEISAPKDSIARFGGDEFVFIQGDINREYEADAFGQRLVKALHLPIEHAGLSAQLSASVGTAVFGKHGDDETQLLRRADIAIYQSKMRGKNRATLFSPEMEIEHERRLAIELEVRRATENKTFTLAYQPQIDLKDNQVTGFEALLRLTSESGEPISPTTFIPVVEKLGLICEVGNWVLKRACETALNWPENILVAVNLSPLQFTSGDAVKAIEDAIRSSGLPAKRLQIEITESTLMESSEFIMRDLNRIKALGVSIAMDDFGTGYSSLSYLWKFPFDKIKIDRSFVTDIGPQKSDARTILHTIISLGHSMSMTVTVEGVETAEQAKVMVELECDQVQGYHYGRPIPEPGVPSYLLQSLIGHIKPEQIDISQKIKGDGKKAETQTFLN